MEDELVKFVREQWGYNKREVEKWLVGEGVRVLEEVEKILY